MDHSESDTLAEGTCLDVEMAIDAGQTTIIVPIGATEQRGSYLPLQTDTTIGKAIAKRLAN